VAGPEHDHRTHSSLEAHARELARDLLAGLPRRWQHTCAVADVAAALAARLNSPRDREALVAAAWLHDTGYAEPLVVTGFHPLDGAYYLAAHRWPQRIAALVAHHSGARFVAAVNGLSDLLAEFPYEASRVSDALTYADQKVGPDGERLTVDERFRDMLARHGPASYNALAHELRAKHIRAAVARVDLWRARRIPSQRRGAPAHLG
jgi:hypothetical protein